MGNSPTNRVLDFLIENDRTSWTMMEIFKNEKIGYATLKYLIPEMIKNELIIIDNQVGKAKLLKINKENSIVSAIINLYCEINKKYIQSKI